MRLAEADSAPLDVLGEGVDEQHLIGELGARGEQRG